MNIDLKLLGQKLEKYRLHLNLDLHEVNQLTGISIEDLLNYERGQKCPSGDHILILSSIYKCDYQFFLSEEKKADFERVETLYRSIGSDTSKADRLAIQEFLYLCECEEFLLTELNIKKEQVFFEYNNQSGLHKTQGIHAAAALRKKLGYKYTHPSPDVFLDFRRLGIHIFRRKLLNSSISGLFINHPTAGKCVLINYDENLYRQRFTVSHEVAHSIFDIEHNVVISRSKYSQKDLQEIRANQFASNYLMPKDVLMSIPNIAAWDPNKAIQCAKQFKVTTGALSIALKQHRLIDKKTYDIISTAKIPNNEIIDPELASNLNEKQLKQKKYLLEKGFSDFYVNLCFEAYYNQIISAARLAEMLLVERDELNRISDLYGRSLNNGY